jgi:hypothetical protein
VHQPVGSSPHNSADHLQGNSAEGQPRAGDRSAQGTVLARSSGCEALVLAERERGDNLEAVSRMNTGIDARHVLPAINVPTLALHCA